MRREKEKAFVSLICLYLKPPHATEVSVKPFSVGYITQQSQKFDGRRGNTRKHDLRFLDSVGARPQCRYVHDRVLKILGRPGLCLIHERKVRIGALLGAPCFSVQYNFFTLEENSIQLSSVGRVNV